MLPKRVVEDIIGRALSGFACQRSGRAAYARALAQRINVVAECMSKRATLASRSTTHPPPPKLREIGCRTEYMPSGIAGGSGVPAEAPGQSSCDVLAGPRLQVVISTPHAT